MATAVALWACTRSASSSAPVTPPATTPLPNATSSPTLPPPATLAPTATATPGPSLEAKIARLLLVGFRGLTIDEAGPVTTAIADDGLGGVILFSTDQLTGQ